MVRKTMTVKEFCERTANAVGERPSDLGTPRFAAMAVLKGLLGVISDEVRLREKITVRGLGTFRLVKLAGGMRRNPATGEAVKVRMRYTVRFRTGAKLKLALAE